MTHQGPLTTLDRPTQIVVENLRMFRKLLESTTTQPQVTRAAIQFASKLKSTKDFQLNKLAHFLEQHKLLSKHNFLTVISDSIGGGRQYQRQKDLLSNRRKQRYIKTHVHNEEQSDEYYYEESVDDDYPIKNETKQSDDYATLLRKMVGKPKQHQVVQQKRVYPKKADQEQDVVRALKMKTIEIKGGSHKSKQIQHPKSHKESRHQMEKSTLRPNSVAETLRLEELSTSQSMGGSAIIKRVPKHKQSPTQQRKEYNSKSPNLKSPTQQSQVQFALGSSSAVEFDKQLTQSVDNNKDKNFKSQIPAFGRTVPENIETKQHNKYLQQIQSQIKNINYSQHIDHSKKHVDKQNNNSKLSKSKIQKSDLLPAATDASLSNSPNIKSGYIAQTYQDTDGLTVKRGPKSLSKDQDEPYKEQVTLLIIKYMKQKKVEQVAMQLRKLVIKAKLQLRMSSFVQIKQRVAEACSKVAQQSQQVEKQFEQEEKHIRLKSAQIFVKARELALMKKKVDRMRYIDILLKKQHKISKKIFKHQLLFALLQAKASQWYCYCYLQTKLKLYEIRCELGQWSIKQRDLAEIALYVTGSGHTNQLQEVFEQLQEKHLELAKNVQKTQQLQLKLKNDVTQKLRDIKMELINKQTIYQDMIKNIKLKAQELTTAHIENTTRHNNCKQSIKQCSLLMSQTTKRFADTQNHYATQFTQLEDKTVDLQNKDQQFQKLIQLKQELEEKLDKIKTVKQELTQEPVEQEVCNEENIHDAKEQQENEQRIANPENNSVLDNTITELHGPQNENVAQQNDEQIE